MQQISQAIQLHSRESTERVAMRLGDVRLTYGELPGRVLACAASLSDLLPPISEVRPVALVGGSTPGLAIHLLALWQLGYGVLPQSDRLPEAERRRVADQAGACATIYCKEEISASSTAESAEPLVLRGWIALPSSGTTGLPKVVRRDSDAIDAVARQVYESVGYRADDHVYASVPLTHAYGLEAGLLAPIVAGSTIELEDAFTPSQLGPRLKATRSTIITAVPAMIDMLVQMHGDEGIDAFPHLRRLLCAGAPLPDTLWHRCHDRLGLSAANYYGATEMGSVCFADPETPGHDASWLGMPMPGVQMCILDPETHGPVEDGELGEIAVASRSLMTGYIQADGGLDQSSAFTEIDNQKFFLTGDLGRRFTDGHLQYFARRKLLIDVGANKVNPMEVEEILRLHPAVKDAMVSAERMNETINRLNAIVELHDLDATPTAGELRSHCRHHLAPWKVPRTFAFEKLPRTALGKVIRVKHEVSSVE
jgi:acyl-CoA synthetase (AMP-forming)/AMP-acid ligase II